MDTTIIAGLAKVPIRRNINRAKKPLKPGSVTWINCVQIPSRVYASDQDSILTKGKKNGFAKSASKDKNYMLDQITVTPTSSEPNKNDGNQPSGESMNSCFHDWEGPFVTLGDFGTAVCRKCKAWEVIHLRDMTLTKEE